MEAIKQARGNQFVGGGIGTPYQLTACPWCGSAIEAGKHLDAQPFPHGSGRTLTYCGDKFGQCLFSKRQAANEGLPVVVVDEEIYRRLPTLLIATVDKFAQMPWKGEVQMLFGQVSGICDRHGFKSPEIEDSTFHPKSKLGLPGEGSRSTRRCVHPISSSKTSCDLISGPLGTLVGLYETAIDKLCTWEVNGKQVRPKVIASTATIKNADVQVRSLFLRTVNIFPPPGLDVRDNFFSVQREPTEQEFGRRYLGICARGVSLKRSLILIYKTYLCAAQALYQKYGKRVDPWMTVVGYFNSMRELGGMRRLVDDQVTSLARKQDRRGLANRNLYHDNLAELTSRMRSEDIPQILDRLEAIFDPELEEQRRVAFKTKDFKNIPKKPLDVLLATNMISVGVDVKRLGLMIVAGQPKATAEYIQATSRVGRTFPGLVCTVFNWARPRDLSHYETFEHYHATFYKHVEPLSVTPFSPGALQRGLAGLLVSLVRLRGVEFNENQAATRITTGNPYVQEAIETIARRAELIGLNGPADGDFCRQELQSKADFWQSEAQNNVGGRTLTYTEPYGSDGPKKGTSVKLLQSPGMERWHEFTCLNSLREVEPSVKFIISDGGLDDVAGASEPESPPTEGGAA
ncbi:MAG: helicase-related protein [Pirellulales bacterium]